MPVSEQINVDRLVKLTFTLNPPFYSPLTSNKTPRYLKSATKHVKTIYREHMLKAYLSLAREWGT